MYKSRRENIFIIAVNCTEAGRTCFCASMKTGPEVTFGFDIALTEIINQNEHFFIIEAGTKKGEDILNKIPKEEAKDEEIEFAKKLVSKAANQMGRKINAPDVKTLLYKNYENPQWDDVAKRCLTCANCTMVCPTCFCTTIEDVTDLKGEKAERWRRWDSCFTMDFSYIHGGSIRSTPMSRYRQWITHKFSTWFDQFGTSGCVGCGRCITWCPVGIDVTEEINKLYETTGRE